MCGRSGPEAFRIPLTCLNDAAALAALEGRIKAEAIAAIERLNLRGVIGDWAKPS
jgi:hypothetical protein